VQNEKSRGHLTLESAAGMRDDAMKLLGDRQGRSGRSLDEGEGMTGRIDAGTLKAWLSDGAEIALIDVREHGQYGEGHPFFAVSLPYSRFELGLPALVPNPATRLVLCDGGDGVAARAARRAETLGCSNVNVLSGGVDGWRSAGYTLYAGVNVPSKTFGELIEHERRTPSITAEALQAMRAAGENLAIVDGRTFAEFQKMSIPGGVSCPNGELPLRIGGLVPDPKTKIVVNCAGRTRSIVGAQTLIDFGVPNPVYALENGTQGWFLAGLQLDHGADRRYGAPPAPDRLGELRARARALAEARGVRFVRAGEVEGWLADRSRTTYLFDVRTPEERAASAVPGIAHAPGGQLVQATDLWIGTRGARIVLVDEEEVRAPMTAQWLRQLGWETCVLVGGMAAASTLAGLRSAVPPPVIPEAEPQARLSGTSRNESSAAIAPDEVKARLRDGSLRLIDLRPSISYRKEHIAGAVWSIRPRIATAVGDLAVPVALIANQPGVAALAALDLAEAGVREVRLMAGGHEAARAAGLPMVATPDMPSAPECIDFLFFTHARHEGDVEAARQYLAWEIALVDQLDAQERGAFRVAGSD
jgi:rhodanese-related sulfurtransferase